MIAAWLLALATVLNIGNQQPTASHWLLLALASVLLTLAAPAAPPALLRARAPTVIHGRRLRAGIAIVALGCVVAAIGGLNGYQNWDYIFGPGLLDYAAGAMLVGVGLALATGWRPGFSPTRLIERVRRHRAEALAVGLVFGLGLVLRLYQLGTYPPSEGYFIIDEPQLGGGAWAFLHHGVHEWVYPELLYSIALSFKLFGASLLTMRYPVVVYGFIALVVFYVLARTFFAWPVAVAGTALLAVSRLEISYSRLVLPSVTIMVIELIIFTLAVRAARGRHTYLNYALMGLLTGLGFYSHASARLIPLLLSLFWIGWLISARHHLGRILRTHVLGWGLFLAVAFIVALPYAGLVRNDPHAFTERLTSIMPLLFAPQYAGDAAAVFHSNLQSILGYFVGPGDGPWANPPQTPMLDAITATFFLLGLGYALLHPRRPYILMMLAWFLLTIITGALLTTDFRPERFIAYLPSLYLLACLPIAVFWRAIRQLRVPWLTIRHLRIPWPSIAAATLIMLLGIAGWTNVDTLFNRQSHDSAVRTAFHGHELDITLYFRDHVQGGPNYVLAGFPFPGIGTDYGWVAGEPPGRNADDLADVLPIHEPVAGTSVHIGFVDPYPVTEMARAVGLIYPGAQIASQFDADTGYSYSAAGVGVAAITAQEGLAGPCSTAAPCAPHAVPARGARGPAFWSGSLYVPAGGTYTMSATIPLRPLLHPTLFVDGRPIVGAIKLYSGWYSVRIAVRGASPLGTPSVYAAGPTGSGPLPPNFLRKTPAHGMLLQYLTLASPAHLLVDPQRVPFPFFFLLGNHNGGRPLTATSNYPYRAMLTGMVAGGHAGTYQMDLYSSSGQTAAFLDGHLVGSGQSTVGGPPTYTPLLLHLTGRPQTLQVEFSTPGTGIMNAGAALFYRPSTSTRSFLPWSWLSPPAASAPLPRWLPW